MAITFRQTPQPYSPASNPCVVEFSSDLAQVEPNFSFIIELIINGQLYGTYKTFPESGDYGKFDASEVLRSILTSPILLGGDLSYPYGSAYCTYLFRVLERYGTPPETQNTVTFTDTFIAFNASLDHLKWIDYNYLDYLVSNETVETDNLFLTYFPRGEREYVGMDEVKFMGVLNDTTDLSYFVILFDAAGSTIATDNNFGNGYVVEPLTIFRADPTALIANTGLTQLDFDAATSYVFSIQDNVQGTFQGVTELYRLYIDRDCQPYGTTRFHWLNKLGAWDSFTFAKVRTDSRKIETSLYEQDRGVWREVVPVNPGDPTREWQYNKENGQKRSLPKYSEGKAIINTDFLSVDVFTWLTLSITESPSVFMETPTGFEPVVITDPNIKTVQRRVDGLLQRQKSFNLDRTYNYRSQLP